jgi:hypothetical protein
VLEVDVLVDLIVDNNLILFISEVHEYALVVPAFGLADKVLAVLHGSEEDLHPLVDVVERLELTTMYDESSGCGLGVAVGDVGGVVFVVLLDFDLVDFAGGLVEGGVIEGVLIDVLIIGLDEEHILLEDSDVLEAT